MSKLVSNFILKATVSTQGKVTISIPLVQSDYLKVLNSRHSTIRILLNLNENRYPHDSVVHSSFFHPHRYLLCGWVTLQNYIWIYFEAVVYSFPFFTLWFLLSHYRQFSSSKCFISLDVSAMYFVWSMEKAILLKIYIIWTWLSTVKTYFVLFLVVSSPISITRNLFQALMKYEISQFRAGPMCLFKVRNKWLLYFFLSYTC